MENQLHVIDPKQDYPHEFDFSGIHYFYNNSWAKKNEYCWIVLTGDWISKKKFGIFYDAESGNEYEDSYIDTKIEVKAMIELQQSPYDENEIWLKFFEVSPEFRNQGVSKQLIPKVIEVFKKKYSGKILKRSRPSKDGEMFLKDNFTKALKEVGIKFEFSS
jgi:GNAT superfamily N-acetyltransferase